MYYNVLLLLCLYDRLIWLKINNFKVCAYIFLLLKTFVDCFVQYETSKIQFYFNPGTIINATLNLNNSNVTTTIDYNSSLIQSEPLLIETNLNYMLSMHTKLGNKIINGKITIIDFNKEVNIQLEKA